MNFCNKELAPLSDLSQNHALPDTVIVSLLDVCLLASYMIQRTVPPTFTDSSAQFYITTELIM